MKSIHPLHLVVALILMGLLGAMTTVGAQSPAASPPAAAAQQAVSPGLFPGRNPIVLPPMPHEAKPDARPYPDYVTEAQKLTRLASDASFKTVRLRATEAAAPSHLVLPIQTQAFGFAPAFRALVGAQLDHELARRGIQASRQTDVLDAYGPFSRRFDDEALDALAKAHPSSTMLGLYLGQDGADKAFLTLMVRQGGKSRQAHRDVALPATASEAAKTFAAVLPSLLNELQLGNASTPSPAATSTDTCGEQAWLLSRPTGAANGLAWACHALVVGTLMPEFEDRQTYFLPPYSPAKLAWLATAFVQAQARAASSKTSKSIQDLAWSQLRLGEAGESTPDHTRSKDPVVSRLAKLIAAQRRIATSPVRSGREATERYVDDVAAGLPAFTQAVFVERGNYAEAFRRVDLCAIERTLPGMMVSAKCRVDDAPAASKTGRATADETGLYREWRLAAFQKDIRYFGHTLGQEERLSQVLAELPGDVARHPFIRQERFKVETFESQAGNFDAYLASLRRSATGFAQSTVDAQRYDATLAGRSLSEHPWVKNSNVTRDPVIAQLTDDEFRLITVLKFDRFGSADLFPASRREFGDPASFLFVGSARNAESRLADMAAMKQWSILAASAAQAGASAALPNANTFTATRSLFMWTELEAPLMTDAELQARIEQFPTDMDSRVARAMQMLKRGRPEVEARRVIDAYPRNSRADEQVGESHVWATPAHAFFFASDMSDAKLYYQRVREIGTGSDSDLHARIRLHLIDGDLASALDATDHRVRRYQSDFARRDLAGLLFMAQQPAQAWSVLTPRLASAKTFQLWVGALVGQRIDGIDLSAVKGWIDRQGLGGAQIDYQGSAELFLHLHGVTDRIPTDEDVAVLKGSGPNGVRWAASARLMQMTLQSAYTRDGFDSVRTLLARSNPERNRFMGPQFAWVAWHATAGKDPELDAIRRTALASDNFDALLAKSLLLALEGQSRLSLDYLRAARYQMSELGLGSPNVERPIPSPYQYALAGYLMHKKTGEEAYRVEALRFARAHQTIFPFWGWSYALEALLERDEKTRALAACRAQFLDPSSYFLSQMKPRVSTTAARCGKDLWSFTRTSAAIPVKVKQ